MKVRETQNFHTREPRSGVKSLLATEMRCRPFDSPGKDFSNVETHDSAFCDSQPAS